MSSYDNMINLTTKLGGHVHDLVFMLYALWFALCLTGVGRRSPTPWSPFSRSSVGRRSPTPAGP